MDAPRRWQIASLATAVTSLGIGGLLLSRPSVEPVAPIVLDATAEHDVVLVPLDGVTTPLDEQVPTIAGIDVVTPQTPVSLTTLDSPDEGPAATPAPTATSSPPVSSSPRPVPTTSAPATSAPTVADDTAPSVDSVDSLDSN